MTDNKKILIIDDDSKLRSLLDQYLTGYGYDVRTLSSGMEAVKEINNILPAMIILDVMMPDKNGLDVLQNIREKLSIPVIMLTAKGEDTDRIVGLELGADDYISKPFNPRELLARIKAVLRRSGNENRNIKRNREKVVISNIECSLSDQSLIIEEQEVELSYTELKLLYALMKNAGTPLTRDDLMTSVWGKDFNALDRSIDVHISKLRNILKIYPEHQNRIKTVWGTGYMFVRN